MLKEQLDWLITKSMGNTKSQQASNCELHPRLGEVKLIETSDKEGNVLESMQITKLMESQQIFNRWYKETAKIQDTITREVLLLPKKMVYQSTGLCGSNGVVHLEYQYYPYVFQVEIENRKNINRYFLETELWYLLYTLVRAGSKFQKYHIKIGDVHPNSILINNDGLIKLISTCSFPGEENNFEKFIQNPHHKVYLAPEELQHTIERAQYPKNIDPSTAECYSIGLCMLSAGTLEDIDSVYEVNGDQRKIQRHKINYYLKLYGQRYSSYLHSMVMSLLAQNPTQRKKCSELYAILFQYQDKILDLQAFMPNNSRLTPYQQQIMTNSRSQRLSQHSQNRGSPYNPIHSQANQTNVYYNPNGVIVNPIQSKYVPVNNHQSMPQQIPNNQRVVYMSNNGSVQGMGTKVSGFNFPKY